VTVARDAPRRDRARPGAHRARRTVARFAVALLLAAPVVPPAVGVAGPADAFDIAPFALPGGAPGEYRFEEPRDIAWLEVRFRREAPRRIGLRYLRRTWPETRLELARGTEDPCAFGWMPVDDWFNGQWQQAAIDVREAGSRAVMIVFRGLAAEIPGAGDYDVTFRRTLGLALDVPDPGQVASVRIGTVSPAAASRLRVQLDAGAATPGRRVRVTGYNARVTAVAGGAGGRIVRDTAEVTPGHGRAFELRVSHMRPAHPYANDDGHVTFVLDDDTFTVSLASLEREGPVWYAERGVYVTFSGDDTRFEDYRRAIAGQRTLNQRVRELPEQTYAGACNGQPRPHPVSYNLGWPHHPHRFRLEPNGDLVLHRWNVTGLPGLDARRFKCDGDARLFFGLERTAILARHTGPPPVPAYEILARDGDVEVRQSSFAAPLEPAGAGAPPAPAGTVVAMVRFRFENRGEATATALLPVGYSHRSARSQNAFSGDWQDDRLVPRGERDSLVAADGRLWSAWHGESVLRARWSGSMAPEPRGRQVWFRKILRPGETCELLLAVPFVAVDLPHELEAMRELDFDRAYQKVAEHWRSRGREGAQLACPEPHLAALHASHLSHVLLTDVLVPDGSGLVNTSVGTSTYGNFANEACMVIHELDQRGLHDEARRRLEVWVRYQGTVPQPGNFTDAEGMYFGAGGFESGAYNQHHGWVLWCLAMHYFLGGDAAWLDRVAPSLVAGCDWVFRQRRGTMGPLPHSRGWEHGFLPAGSLEDVTDFHYWLSTNAITWRGVRKAGEALAAIGHPEAARIRLEADAYGDDLRRGFELMRRHAPLVRLRDGRWVPHYPSRLYRRGRDIGWIREVLEGSVYLLTTGLYDPRSPQAAWILDDYQDNRYVAPPYGYPMANFEANWFDRGGFSIQPDLLAGLMPHLDRDEPEIFLRMFFNAWCACYRDEINAMVEHPNPELGYSTAAHFKTSDESNAIAWLRAMLVYASDEELHLGRALPREWLASGEPILASGVATRYGTVDVRYEASNDRRRITATLGLRLRDRPASMRVRFRHPDLLPLRAVRVNGRPHLDFDPRRNDVDVTGLAGDVVVEADF